MSEDTSDRVLAAFVKRMVAARGSLSQRELAKRSNVDISTISRIENGKLTPSLTVAVQIASALGVALADLIDEDAPLPVRAGLTPLESELLGRLESVEAGLASLREVELGTRVPVLEDRVAQLDRRLEERATEEQVELALRLTRELGDRVVALEAARAPRRTARGAS